ncbi:hypothetical protein [Streptomyces showdoensis]|uniref:Uncharacterized protein n=1 Tax=Streptomyces showdoensis TaxID=68268 RepID=A0A2P2GKL8_STREW|nr:hypothetical protein [Streptomyces showdoensis]KKZ72047.1 hypothetical protein VO63_19855 [Streptomyces showdoensis]
MYTNFAPNPADAVPEEIRIQRRHLESGRRVLSTNHIVAIPAGRYQGVGGAVIEADLQVKFSRKRKHGSFTEMQDGVAIAALVRCAGNGCADQEHQVPATDAVPLSADADEASAAALAPLAAARKWAQQHAETCRALPYNGR